MQSHDLAAPLYPTKRVLIAEDNLDILDILASIFEMHNYAVATVKDGQAALDYLQRAAPDVAILDLNMPKLSGYQVLERLHAADTPVTTKVIIMTGSVRAHADVGAQLADLVLVKPVPVEELIAFVQRLSQPA